MNLAGRRKSHIQSDSGAGMVNLYSSLQDEINAVFDEFFKRKLALGENDMDQAFVPAIDIIENEKSYSIKAELPGLKEDEIDLQVDNGQLIIKGERKQQYEVEIESMLVNESSYGSFYRSFPLPDNVDAERKYSANLQNGILSINIPKKKDTKSKVKSIPIKAK